MENTDIDELKFKNFNTKLQETNGALTLYLAGEMDVINPGETIYPYFKKVHEKVCMHELKEIDLNVEQLSFINSSNIKVLLNWLLDVKSLEKEKRYNVRLLYDKNCIWQVTAFKPLSIFAADCFSM